MLFQPKDVLSKFGFNPPMGLFVDKNCSTVIKNSLSNDEYNEFKSYASKNQDVNSIIEWYEDKPDLTKVEIERTWDSEEDGNMPDSLDEAWLMVKTKFRAIKEVMAQSIHENPEPEEYTIKDLKQFFDYSKWKKLYKMRDRGGSK